MAGALPARYPPHGAWPAVMRADVVAAFFDCKDTKALAAAVLRGDVPPPCGSFNKGRAKEPIWTIDYCRDFLVRRYGGSAGQSSGSEDLADLV